MSHAGHVLIVDDEEDLSELLAMRLEHHGFLASREATIQGAVEVMERGLVDAMIVDLRLDGESGLDLLDVVQARSLDIPVIMLTAHGSVESAVEAMRRGAYGFLTKPFHDHELLEKVRHGVERARLRREVAGLRRIVGEDGSAGLLGTSSAIADVRARIDRIAASDAIVLLMGESGTGKELAARSIHARSGRSGPYLAVNCAALPEPLLESELFGHVQGSFTGATKDKEGLFQAARGGTVFLDEIGDAPSAVQVKLLRVLQEREVVPVGATKPVPIDARIVAATHRDLAKEVEAGRFRQDLFYRLHVMPVVIPPLRQRRDDIPLLAELFLSQSAGRHGVSDAHLSSEALALLLEHDWPGNVRELANVVEGAALLSTDGTLRPQHIRSVLAPRPSAVVPPAVDPLERARAASLDEADFPTLRVARERFDEAYVEEALRRSGGNVTAAARLAGRNRTDFHALMKRLGISSDGFRG